MTYRKLIGSLFTSQAVIINSMEDNYNATKMTSTVIKQQIQTKVQYKEQELFCYNPRFSKMANINLNDRLHLLQADNAGINDAKMQICQRRSERMSKSNQRYCESPFENKADNIKQLKSFNKEIEEIKNLIKQQTQQQEEPKRWKRIKQLFLMPLREVKRTLSPKDLFTICLSGVLPNTGKGIDYFCGTTHISKIFSVFIPFIYIIVILITRVIQQ